MSEVIDLMERLKESLERQPQRPKARRRGGLPKLGAGNSHTIVKVQMPLGGDMSRALVYNQDSSYQAFVPVEAAAPHMGSALKRYFRAEVAPDGSCHLLERVGDQPW